MKKQKAYFGEPVQTAQLGSWVITLFSAGTCLILAMNWIL